MRKVLFIAILAVVSLSVTATVKKVKMYDNPPKNKDVVMKNEVPTTVTYEGDSIHMVSDSLLTNVNIVVRSVSGEILLQSENQTIGTTPLSYFVNNIGNRFFTIEISTNNITYSGSSYVYLKPEVAAFIYNQSYIGDTISYYIRLMDTGIEEDKSWDIYVDENPNAPWPHSMSKYHTTCYQFDYESVYFSFDGNPTFSLESELSDCQKFSSYAYGNNCNLKPSVTVSNITNSAATNTYAIIMGGGTNKYNNSEEYWNDCSLMYQTLVNKYKIPKNNVQVYFGKGTDSIPTIRRADWQGFKVMSKDLDSDGENDIVGPSNTSLFIDALSDLDSLPDADKAHVFVFFIGEGGTFNKGSFHNPVMDTSIQFWEDETPSVGMWYDHASLESLLQDLNFNSLNIFFGQDFSTAFMNGFQDELETVNSDLSCVLTASSNGVNSYCEDKPYHEFVYNWLTALNECDIHANTPVAPITIGTYDTNRNGFITMNEAYSYAVNHSSTVAGSYSNPQDLYNEWGFATIAPAYTDLFVKDFSTDVGATPSTNTSGTTFTFPSSTDIYTRHENDSTSLQTNQLPDLSSPNCHSYFYTRVRNRGIEEYNGGGMYIHAYWFIPSNYGMGSPLSNPISNESDFGLINVKEINSSILQGENATEVMLWQIADSLINANPQSLGYLVELSSDSIAHAKDNATVFRQLYHNVFDSNDITYRKSMYMQISPFLSHYTVDLTKGNEDEESVYEVLPESSTDGNVHIERLEDKLRVDIEYDDCSEGEHIYHVVQKSKDTGALKDEITLTISRIDEDVEENGDGVQPVNSILSLAKDASNNFITILLQNEADDNTQIQIERVSTSVSSQTYVVNEGLHDIRIPISAVQDGFYNVKLIVSGECVDSKKVY